MRISKVRITRGILCALAILWAPATMSVAQQVTPATNGSTAYDYVQSSSPLVDGRLITTTRYPSGQQPGQTIISQRPVGYGTTPPIPLVAQANAPRTAYQVPANTSPVLNSPPLPNSPTPAAPSGTCVGCTPTTAPGQVYAYPAQTPASGKTLIPGGPKPLVKLRRKQTAGAFMGQGIFGQPVVYVPREPVRNAMRYIFP